MRAFSYVAAFALLLFSNSAFSADDAPQTIRGGLVRVPDAKVALAYERPGTDWSKFKTIKLNPLGVSATARDTAPKGTRPEFGQRYMMDDREVASLQKSYDDATRDELSKGGYTFVTTPQADTLIVAAQIIKIELNAPIEDTRMGPRSRTFTRGSGAMSIAAVFGDGASGAVIAEAADRKYSNDEFFSRNLSSTNRAEARGAFRDWARALRNRLTSRRVATP